MSKNMNEETNIIVVRGAGDIASGVIYRLHQCGFKVMALEIENPTVIRRTVAFASAVKRGGVTVEGLTALRCATKPDILRTFATGKIPICVDPQGLWIKHMKPFAVVDAILAKKNLGTSREMASVVIGVGPGFTAGLDVDVVIETNRGHDLGRVIHCGSAAENTGIPGDVAGHTQERVVRAPSAGVISIIRDIGELVVPGDSLATIGDKFVTSKITGVIRGIIADNSYVFEGMKIGDIDPRGSISHCYTISDKARNISGGVLEAVFHYLSKSQTMSISLKQGCVRNLTQKKWRFNYSELIKSAEIMYPRQR